MGRAAGSPESHPMTRRANPHIPPPGPSDPAKVRFYHPGTGEGGVRVCKGADLPDIIADLKRGGYALRESRADAPNPGRL